MVHVQGYPHGGLDPALAQYGGGLPYGLQNGGAGGGGVNPLGPPPLNGGTNPLLAAAAAAAAGGQLPSRTGANVPALTSGLAAAALPMGGSGNDAAATAAAAANAPDGSAVAGAAQLLGSLNNLSLSDQASIATAAGAAGALQAAGNLATGSEADAQAQVGPLICRLESTIR